MNDPISSSERRIAVFQRKEISRALHDDAWWFVIEDLVFALTGSADPRQYIQRMQQRDPELAKGWVRLVRTLAFETEGGPQAMNCANTEGILA